ncbi:MAG: hypothetical protein D6784_14585 [Chloroflexi bacterium]|nr:MAG: hypothetical protein D6784_14585 [Chloroflexota bacterium]
MLTHCRKCGAPLGKALYSRTDRCTALYIGHSTFACYCARHRKAYFVKDRPALDRQNRLARQTGTSPKCWK